MYVIDRLPNVIDIGLVGEKNFRNVEIDMSPWMAEMPDGIPNIIVIRPGESENEAYIAATTFDDNILTWIVSESDTEKDGTGTIQIWLELLQDGAISKRGKSVTVATRVHESIMRANSTVPPPQTSWIDLMTRFSIQAVTAKDGAVEAQEAAETAQGEAVDAKEAAEAAAEAAQGAIAHTPYIDETTGNWMCWSFENEQYYDTEIHAQGPQGEAGRDGQDGINGLDGRDGQDGRDGTDGQDGQDGAPGADAYVYIRYAADEPTQDSDMKITPDAWMGVYSGPRLTAPTEYTDYAWQKVRGEDGQDGTDGTNAYVHIRYAANQPTQDSDMKTTPDAWIGVYSGDSSTAPTSYTSYAWQKIKGEDGQDGQDGRDGADGQNGTDGTDGTNAYVHIRYAANTPTQDSDMKTTPDAWMGVYSGDSATAPTTYTSYDWQKVKGETGNGVPNVTSADNGKFLVVVNGAWAAQTVPAAAGVSF